MRIPALAVALIVVILVAGAVLGYKLQSIIEHAALVRAERMAEATGEPLPESWRD